MKLFAWWYFRTRLYLLHSLYIYAEPVTVFGYVYSMWSHAVVWWSFVLLQFSCDCQLSLLSWALETHGKKLRLTFVLLTLFSYSPGLAESNGSLLPDLWLTSPHCSVYSLEWTNVTVATDICLIFVILWSKVNCTFIFPIIRHLPWCNNICKKENI